MADLKHMTSNSALAPRTDHRRTSQHLRTADPRLGSPTSIPSSPTSVHSSSSAIFERDIEPLVPSSPPHYPHSHSPSSTLSPNTAYHHNQPTNPHRIPRSKGTEALDYSVPSVLDSAAAILGSLTPDSTDPMSPSFSDQVAVVAPAPAMFDMLGLGSPGSIGAAMVGGMGMGRTSGFASPIGSFRSRSPSPLGVRIGVGAESLLGGGATGAPTSVLGLQGLGPAPRSSSSIIETASAGSISPVRPAIRTTDTAGTITAASAIATSTTGSTTDNTSATLLLGQPTTTGSGSGSLSPAPSLSARSLPSPPLSPSLSTSSNNPTQNSTLRSPSITSALLPSSSSSTPAPNSITNPTASPLSLSHPPSPTLHPTSGVQKRLSFMSYADLRASTPATTTSLRDLTSGAGNEPPPHIPGVSQALATSSMSPASTSMSGLGLGGPGDRSSVGRVSAAPSLRGLSLTGLGEWEREGLGLGLEARLEAGEGAGVVEAI